MLWLGTPELRLQQIEIMCGILLAASTLEASPQTYLATP